MVPPFTASSRDEVGPGSVGSSAVSGCGRLPTVDWQRLLQILFPPRFIGVSGSLRSRCSRLVERSFLRRCVLRNSWSQQDTRTTDLSGMATLARKSIRGGITCRCSRPLKSTAAERQTALPAHATVTAQMWESSYVFSQSESGRC